MQFLLRGAAGGNARLGLESSFGGDGNNGGRFNFEARARSWDQKSRTLALASCEFETSRPTVSNEANGEGAQSRAAGTSFKGESREKLRTELTLREGQETVVGSLGGNSTLIVLRFTLD